MNGKKYYIIRLHFYNNLKIIRLQLNNLVRVLVKFKMSTVTIFLISYFGLKLNIILQLYD